MVDGWQLPAALDDENRDLVAEAGEICCISFICSSVEKLACDHWLVGTLTE